MAKKNYTYTEFCEVLGLDEQFNIYSVRQQLEKLNKSQNINIKIIDEPTNKWKISILFDLEQHLLDTEYYYMCQENNDLLNESYYDYDNDFIRR